MLCMDLSTLFPFVRIDFFLMFILFIYSMQAFISYTRVLNGVRTLVFRPTLINTLFPVLFKATDR